MLPKMIETILSMCYASNNKCHHWDLIPAAVSAYIIHDLNSLDAYTLCTVHKQDSVVARHKRTNYRAGGIGPAAPVLAGPFFLKVKVKFHFCKRQVINKVLV